jgi:hypothetical protein
MFSLKTRPCRLVVQIAAILTVAQSSAVAQSVPSNCIALANISNDLWLIQSNSQPLRRLTNDGNLKPSAAISPDGKVVVYSGKAPPNDISFIDTSGRLLADFSLSASDAITNLRWIGNDLLSAGEHVSPYSSRFTFLKVPTNPFTSVSYASSNKFYGGTCALAPDGKNTACFAGGDLNLNDGVIFSLPGAFDSAITLQTIDAVVGATVSTATNPSFSVKILKLDKGIIGLRVTTPDGLWQEQYVNSGDSMPLNYAGDDAKAAPQYGVIPTVKNGNNGVITLTVKQSKSGNFSFEASPAWDLRGKRIGFIQANGIGERFLVLINKEFGSADQNNGGVDLTMKLPINGPIASIKFTSDTHVVVEGQTQIFEEDIPAQGKVPSNASYTIKPALPKQLNVLIGQASTLVDVKGWFCQ